MQPFTQRVVMIIRSIPPGKVMTYGSVAASAGSVRAARQVVRILHTLSTPQQLPWHRVVNKYGQIALGDPDAAEEQRLRLEEEGIVFMLDGSIPLDRYRFEPDLPAEQ
ncbi:MGMT family protein [Paenibacillus sp. SGZ-1009]|uniref:MGMT family protein n=1 Tax=Paenibacillus campi TaxID=3106031 RepID=UPI002B000F19|nr:MGMT family protein [Paenibacillus sp. SGZ-1009]